MVDLEEVTAGANIIVKVTNPDSPFEYDWHSLMQRSSTRTTTQPPSDGQSRHSCLNPYAASFQPNRGSILAQDEFVQALQPLWEIATMTQPDAHSGHVAVWFVDHLWQSPHGHQFRKVRLGEDFTDWQRLIENAWSGLRIQGTDIEFHLVEPKPSTVDPTIFAHVIVIQRPQGPWVTTLVTTVDISASVPEVRQMAVTTLEHILLDHVLQVVGLYEACVLSPITRFYKAWWRHQQLQLGRPLMGRSGYSIDIQHRTTISYFAIEGQDEVVTLQLQHLVRPPEKGERLTSDAVAQAHWPPFAEDPRTCDHVHFPTVGQHILEDWQNFETTVLTRVHHVHHFKERETPPQFIELPAIHSSEDAQAELEAWGFPCRAFLCGAHDAIFIVLHGETMPPGLVYVYCGQDPAVPNAVLVHQAAHEMREEEHMRLLHTKGFTKAVIRKIDLWNQNLLCVHFEDVQPQQDPPPQRLRTRTPWPTQQSRQIDSGKPFTFDQVSNEAPACLLHFDCQEAIRFLQGGRDLLWRDFQALALPEFIQQALESCTTIERIDRYVIFTDGSSQTCHKHKPPEWIAENDTSDAWAFVVLGEQYPDDPGQPAKIQFLGCHCQQVLYESQAEHHIGTDHVGSDAAETEAIFWAGLWRIAQNNRVPTAFLSDSRLVGDQAAGRIGSTVSAAPFRHLRAVFQTLSACLPNDGLCIEHVRSHTGDPFNEFADWLAKTEAQTSLFLKRQPVDMKTFGSLLQHLWMTVAGNHDLPPLTSTGFDVGPCRLPSRPSTEQTVAGNSFVPESQMAQFSLSFATANVRTFYRGDEGCPGKLAYVREQFVAHHLNFLGIQEACTPFLPFNNKFYVLPAEQNVANLELRFGPIWINHMRGLVDNHTNSAEMILL